MPKEDLDFQIIFFEKLIQEKPDYIDVLVALSDAYTKKGLYGKGLEIDKRLSKLKPDDPIVYYNIACDYSLLKDANLSLDALEKAIKLGYRDFEFMQKDTDLEYIRQDERYKEILSKMKKEIEKAFNSGNKD